jgi:hypothetical protein
MLAVCYDDEATSIDLHDEFGVGGASLGKIRISPHVPDPTDRPISESASVGFRVKPVLAYV